MFNRYAVFTVVTLLLSTMSLSPALASDAVAVGQPRVVAAEISPAANAVTNDGGVRFGEEFARLGGWGVLGYPVSDRFIWSGFVTQVMQKAVFQWRPEANRVFFVNVFDELHAAGKDDWLVVYRSTPRPLDSSFDAGKSSAQIVRDRLGLLDANPAIKAQYWSVSGMIDPLLLYGLPTSPVVDNGNHYAIRLQRAVIQQWKVAVPWARAGQVTVANGGDIAKEGGIIAQSPVPTSVERTFAAQPLAPFSASQPFTDVPKHADENYEAKGALQWLPQIKFAVRDAARAGLLREDEVPLWVNLMVGQIGLESAGRNFSVAGSGAWVSQGLTQLVNAHLYPSENPFDPLTNLRVGLRTVIRYYRMHGNRWDRAVAQHLTGKSDEAAQRDTRDWAGTSGLDYAKRVINGAWSAQRLLATGGAYPPNYQPYQRQGNGGFDRAPSWDIFNSPNLPFNWTAPRTSTAGDYQSRGADGNIRLPGNRNVWVPTPDWFYGNEIGSNVAVFSPAG